MANPRTVHPLDRWTNEERTRVLAGDTLRRGRPVRDWDLWGVALYLAALGVSLWAVVNW